MFVEVVEGGGRKSKSGSEEDRIEGCDQVGLGEFGWPAGWPWLVVVVMDGDWLVLRAPD